MLFRTREILSEKKKFKTVLVTSIIMPLARGSFLMRINALLLYMAPALPGTRSQ